MLDRLRTLGWQVHRSSLVANTMAGFAQEGVLFLHYGRCGSTVLARLLNQHPRLRSFGEIFHHYSQQNPPPAPAGNMLRACRTVAFPLKPVAEVKFFECMHIAAFGQTIPEFLDCAHAAGYRQHLVLNRKNYLHACVSVLVAAARGGQQTKAYHYAVGQSVPKTTVNVPLDALRILGKKAPILELFDYMDEQNAKLREHLVGQDMIELTYEDDIEVEPRLAYEKVCNWLQVPPAPAEVTLTRARNASIQETVSNWDEVVDALSGTRHAWMLR